MIKQYFTILDEYNYELIEKKSKFICNIFHIENEEQAKEKISYIKKKYYDARHNVFAYTIVTDNNLFEKFSDDGEPSGTAGKPILEVLKQKELYNVLIVVTRYFGGILLGTGGLVRAYTQSTLECINISNIVQKKYMKAANIKLDYSELDNIKYYFESNNILINKIEYLQQIEISFIYQPEFELEIKSAIENILSKTILFDNIRNEYITG